MGAVRVLAFALFGLVFGSFLTVVVHRVPKKQSIVAPRSRCPRCGAEILARDNIPVVSWVLLRGRCRSCGARVSLEYPATEAATAGLFAAAAALVDPLYAAAVIAVFAGVMLAVALIDARHRIVPNRVTYPAVGLFAAAIAVGDLVGGGVDLPRALIGMVAYAGPLLLVALIAPGGMGMGDVKLAALIGLVAGSLGLRHVLVAAGVGILLGGLGSIFALVVLRYGRRQQIPFGPYLAAGGVVAVLAGSEIASAYLSIL